MVGHGAARKILQNALDRFVRAVKVAQLKAGAQQLVPGQLDHAVAHPRQIRVARGHHAVLRDCIGVVLELKKAIPQLEACHRLLFSGG